MHLELDNYAYHVIPHTCFCLILERYLKYLLFLFWNKCVKLLLKRNITVLVFLLHPQQYG